MRIAVIGLGSAGLRHAAVLKVLGAEVLGWDEVQEARAAAVVDVPVARCAEEAYEGAAGVVVATPPAAHLPVVLEAVRRGAHVLCEKPIAHRSDSVELVLSEAEAARRQVLVGYCWRHWPPLQWAYEALLDGRIGKPQHFRAAYGDHLGLHRPRLQPNPRQHWIARRADGGGALLDLSHAIDYVRWLMGEIAEVRAMTLRLTEFVNPDVEDTAHLWVRCASGAIGYVALSLAFPVIRGELSIDGDKGALEWNRHRPELRLWGGHCWETRPWDGESMYAAQARHFLRVVGGYEPALVDGWDALSTLRVVEAARQAAASSALLPASRDRTPVRRGASPGEAVAPADPVRGKS